MVLVAAALVVAAPALAGNGGFAPVEPRSPNAEGIRDSYWLILAVVLAIFALVEGLLVSFVIRFRRGRRQRFEDGARRLHGKSSLEVLWTAVPVLILFAIVAFVFVKLPGIRNVPSADAAAGRLDVRISAHRYYWQFEYPNGVVAVDTLRAPVGQPVKLIVSAPDDDVIHSWWIPALGGKIDAIPGQTNHTWFTVDQPGVYKGRCAELCGLLHAEMLAWVEAVPKPEFDAWLEREAAAQQAGTSKLGEQTYAGACAKCHGLAGEGDIGPKLDGSAVASDPAGIEKVVREGRNAMPAVGAGWSDSQLDALTGYVKERFGSGG
jgi:cytochrome c oxidase subunit 2